MSSQRFAWCWGPERWWQSDYVRTNVPISSDAAECLYDGLYRLPAVSSFADFEHTGMGEATIGIAHFDLDGHPANPRMVAGHRTDLPTSTLVSIRHCGNHANNLVENCVVDAVSTTLLAWLYMVSILLSMGGNFLRLIHGTSDMVNQHMRAPLREGVVPESVRLLAAEIKDYSIRNYKAFTDATTLDEAWSSDESDDNTENASKRGQGHWAFTNAALCSAMALWGRTSARARPVAEGTTRPSHTNELA